MRAAAAWAVALALTSGGPAGAGTSTVQNPVVTFAAPGVKQVTLQVCNSRGCTNVTKNVVVLDPMPEVTSMSVTPGTSEVGQLVRLAGTATGKPPLTYTWRITSGATTRTLDGPEVWWDTAGEAAGVYSVSLEVSNSVPPGVAALAVATPVLVTLVPERATSFYTVPPCRILDTRPNAALASGERRTIAVGGVCGIPLAARAVAANVTAVPGSASGQLSLFPGNYPTPVASVLHFAPWQNRASFAVVPLATDGTGTAAAVASAAGGDPHLVIDVSGYFLADPPPLP